MAQPKLRDITKKLEISNKEAMFFLEKINMGVKSSASSLNYEQIEELKEYNRKTDKYKEIRDEFNKIEEEKKKAKREAKKKTEKKEPEKQESKKEEVKEDETKKREPKKEDKKTEKIKEKKVEEKKEEKIVKEKKPKKDVKKESIKKEEVKTEKKIEVKKNVKTEEHKEERKEPKKQKHQDSKKLKKTKKEEKVVLKEEKKDKQKVEEIKEKKPEKKQIDIKLPEIIQVSNFLTLKELADILGVKMKYLTERLRSMNKDYMSNQIMEIEDVQVLCQELGVEVDVVSFEDYVFYNNIEKYKDELKPRSAIVTVMGHVDHGKTTLLDTLRKTRVAEKEAGGITQTIGAYRVRVNNNDIVFIDTPGHKAFTNLRARGAKVTDIVILVVAANDGVQPQTIEAINHAKAANVPMIVAINKIDLPGANSDKVKEELARHNIIVEDWGGDVVSVEISAKKNINIDSLLEMISLVAEMQELKAYKNIPARGTIIESRLDPRLGPVATVLIQHGKLKVGQYFICGNAIGKVKSILDDTGKFLKEGVAPVPVEIMGFEEVPESGDIFQIVEDFEKAKKVIEMRKIKLKERKSEEIQEEKRISLHNLFKNIEQNKIKSFPVIIKTDNFGSGEVLEKVLLNQSNEKIKIEIIHKGIGNISETDVLLASTANAIIIGFNVKIPQKIISVAKRENVEVKLYSVIYHLIDDIEKALKGEIEPEYIEELIGKVEVLQKFKISKLGVVAGCIVREGKVTNKSLLKVYRGNDLLFEGSIENLKRVKDDVSEVRAGTECGIKVKNFNDIEVGDIFEVYEKKIKE